MIERRTSWPWACRPHEWVCVVDLSGCCCCCCCCQSWWLLHVQRQQQQLWQSFDSGGSAWATGRKTSSILWPWQRALISCSSSNFSVLFYVHSPLLLLLLPLQIANILCRANVNSWQKNYQSRLLLWRQRQNQKSLNFKMTNAAAAAVGISRK